MLTLRDLQSIAISRRLMRYSSDSPEKTSYQLTLSQNHTRSSKRTEMQLLIHNSEGCKKMRNTAHLKKLVRPEEPDNEVTEHRNLEQQEPPEKPNVPPEDVPAPASKSPADKYYVLMFG